MRLSHIPIKIKIYFFTKLENLGIYSLLIDLFFSLFIYCLNIIINFKISQYDY